MATIEREFNVECLEVLGVALSRAGEMRSMRHLSTFVQSKYNKHFKKVLTVLDPAKQQPGDITASSRLELHGEWAPKNDPVCAGTQS